MPWQVITLTLGKRGAGGEPLARSTDPTPPQELKLWTDTVYLEPHYNSLLSMKYARG